MLLVYGLELSIKKPKSEFEFIGLVQGELHCYKRAMCLSKSMIECGFVCDYPDRECSLYVRTR